MCEVVSILKIESGVKDLMCNDRIDQTVYMNIIIVGIACIPTSLIVPLFVNKLGLRFFTGSHLIIASLMMTHLLTNFFYL